MGRRSTRRPRSRDTGNDSTLKRVLKMSAQEHASNTSQPASPSPSAVSNDSEESSVSRSGSKKNRKPQGQPPTKVARLGKRVYL